VDKGEAVGAFESLVDEFGRRISGLVRKHLADPSLTDDIVQETFLRAFRSFDSLDPDRDPWPWLSTIAIRLCRDHSRLASCRCEYPASPDAMASQQLLRHQYDELAPDESLMRSELRMSVREALARLSPSQRRLLSLCDAHGVERAAMAESEGVKPGTLRAQLSRARQAFRLAYAAVVEERGLEVATWPVLGAALARWRYLRAKAQELWAAVPALQQAGHAVSALVVVSVVSGVLVAGIGSVPPPDTKGEARVTPSVHWLEAPPAEGVLFDVRHSGSAHGGNDGALRVRTPVDEVVISAPGAAKAEVSAERNDDEWTIEYERWAIVPGSEFGRAETVLQCDSGGMTSHSACAALDVVADLGEAYPGADHPISSPRR
jgi:RNA polymerase sigma-70 factor, ECF subfamily